MPRQEPALLTVEVRLPPEDLAVVWRPATHRLLLETGVPVHLRQRLAVRLQPTGFDVGATVTGRVASLHALGEAAWRFELEADPDRLRGLHRLLAVVRGERSAFRRRPPRFLTRLPAVVAGHCAGIYMEGISVSERGCALAWSGDLPELGDAVDVRLGAGVRAAVVRGQVRWRTPPGRGAAVGLRLLAGASWAWSSLLWEVARAGAPPA